jgi:hypothetical protein
MLDLDPRDYDSRDEERHANTPRRGGRGGSGDNDRDHDWRQPDARTRDRDDGDERPVGRGPGNDRQGSYRHGGNRDQDPRRADRDRDDRERDREVPDAFTRHVHLPRGPERELVHDRIVFPRPLDHAYDAYQVIIHEELESPLHPVTISELQSYFELRLEAARGEPMHPLNQGFLSKGHEVFAAARFTDVLPLAEAPRRSVRRPVVTRDRRGLEQWPRPSGVGLSSRISIVISFPWLPTRRRDPSQ